MFFQSVYPDPNAKTRADNFKLVYKTEYFVLK